MYHGLWSHYCMFPVFKLITVMFIQKFFAPFLLLWGSRTERSVKTSFPSFFFFLLNLCWRCECLCLFVSWIFTPSLNVLTNLSNASYLFHPVFHGFIYCNVKQKKNLMNIDALVQIQKIEAEALQLVESLIPVLCFLTIAPGHVIHVICVFIYLSTWNCNDAVDDRSQGELGVDWPGTWRNYHACSP